MKSGALKLYMIFNQKKEVQDYGYEQITRQSITAAN